MQMGGMTRKLKNLFQAAQLDAHARARLPLVCDGQGVLYIPYVGTCDRAQAKEGDARTYLFYTESAPQDALK
jgi:tRNA(Ile)-lysidine synthetase-like protein